MGSAAKLLSHSRASFPQHARMRCRCHCIAGYVVPRAELAFTNPTAAGCAFARAYSQGDEFLVYK